MGSLCAVALIVLGPRTDYTAIPLGPLSSTAPELSLGIYTIGASHVLLAPTVLQPSPFPPYFPVATSLAMLLNAEVVVKDLGKDLAMFCVPDTKWCPRCRNLLTPPLPYGAGNFFANSLDENIKIACFYWPVSESREFLLRFPGYRALEQRIKPGLHRR